MQKLYCYVDETGQDTKSQFFIAVAVVSGDDQHILREKLIQIEKKAKTGHRKWHKSKPERRLAYLTTELFFKQTKNPRLFLNIRTNLCQKGRPLPRTYDTSIIPAALFVKGAIKFKKS